MHVCILCFSFFALNSFFGFEVFEEEDKISCVLYFEAKSYCGLPCSIKLKRCYSKFRKKKILDVVNGVVICINWPCIINNVKWTDQYFIVCKAFPLCVDVKYNFFPNPRESCIFIGM